MAEIVKSGRVTQPRVIDNSGYKHDFSNPTGHNRLLYERVLDFGKSKIYIQANVWFEANTARISAYSFSRGRGRATGSKRDVALVEQHTAEVMALVTEGMRAAGWNQNGADTFERVAAEQVK